MRRASEFEEYFVHYPIKQSRYSSHYYAQRFVGRGQETLDIGCGEGFFAAELVKNGNLVTGVDSLETAHYSEALQEYFSVDLNGPAGSLTRVLGGRKFDRALLLDVLEHLIHPENLLAETRETLNRHGKLIVSVPNVANITVRLMLLLGKFDYTERGLLDRTHVRFYTRKTARAMLEQAGYRIVAQRMAVVPIELALGLSPKAVFFKILNRVAGALTALMPTLFGYQIILVAQSNRNS